MVISRGVVVRMSITPINISPMISHQPALWLPIHIGPDTDLNLLLAEGPAEALELLKDASPEKPGLLYNRAVINLRQNRYEEARADLEAALPLLPDFIFASAALILAGLKADKVAALQKLREIAESSGEMHLYCCAAVAHMNQAAITMMQANADPAELALAPGWAAAAQRLMADATVHHPERVEAWYIRGALQLDGDLNDLAEQSFSRALELDPDNLEILTERGRSRVRQFRFEEAIADYEEALRSDPQFLKAYGYMDIAYGRAGDMAGALRTIQRCIAATPDQPYGYARLANHFLALGQPSEALRVIDEAITEKGLPPNYFLIDRAKARAMLSKLS